MNKVFGIGLSRTGTNSLNEALNILNIKSIHMPTDITTISELESGNYNLSLLEDYIGLTDIVTVPFFPQLDKEYPGSKFILTIREKESWLNSIEKHWTSNNIFSKNRHYHPPMMQFIIAAVYGCYDFNRNRFSWVYDNHLNIVETYFKDKNNLLIIDICGGEGWAKLCPFLDRKIPSFSFPYVPSRELLPI